MDTLLQKIVRIVHEHVNPDEAKELNKFRDELAEYNRADDIRQAAPRTVPKITVVDDSLDYAIVDGWFCVALRSAPYLRDLRTPERLEFMESLALLAKRYLPKKVA